MLPPQGLDKPIQLQYGERAKLPTAECCFNLLTLPLGVDSKDEFFKSLDTGVLYSGSYFGLM